MPENLPAITGRQLIRLLERDGWIVGNQRTHGVSLRKTVSDRTLITIVPNKTETLKPGTLSEILGPRQTQLGKDGLQRLIDAHGLR